MGRRGTVWRRGGGGAEMGRGVEMERRESGDGEEGDCMEKG